MRPWQKSQPFSSSSSPPFVDGESGDDQFASEAFLTQVSMLDNVSMASNMMGSAIDDSPPFRPSSSPAPIDTHIAADMYDNSNVYDNDDDNQKTPMPDNIHHLPNDDEDEDDDSNHLIEQQQQHEIRSSPQQHLQIPRPSASAGTSYMFADHSSLFEQESRLDAFEQLSMADGTDNARSSQPINDKHVRHVDGDSNKRDPQKERSTTLALKEQEKTIDILKKDNFGLKLKIYYLEKRLDDLSPDQVDNALKENVDLKVNIQTLTRELRKYKNMILELHSAMDILQRSSQRECSLPHGMSSEEQAEYDTAITNATRYREENERLHKMMADLSSENSRLRASMRSSRTSSPALGVSPGAYNSPRSSIKISRSNSNGSRHDYEDEDEDQWINHRRLPTTSSSNKDMVHEVEMYRREWLQAKQTIDRQNQTIQLLREENEKKASSSPSNHKAPSDSLVKSILADRDAYVARADQYMKTNHELNENLGRMQERHSEVMAQLLSKNKELDRMHENMDELMRSLHDTKKMLRNKSNENQKLRQELDTLQDRRANAASPNVSELLTTVNDLRIENGDLSRVVGTLKRELKDTEHEHQHEMEKLEAEIEKREQQFVALEAQVVKVMTRAEKLEAREKEKDMLIEELERKLEAMERNQYDDEIERLEQELQVKDDQIGEYERRLEEIESQENDLSALEERYMQVEERMRHKDTQIKDLEYELESALEKTQETKARYEEDLQLLEQQFKEVEQAMRERDVRIASLEGHLEAQADAVQREKSLHREELKEADDKMRELADLLREKDILLANVEEQLNERMANACDIEEAYERDLADIKEQLGARMIEIEEEWKGRVAETERRLKEAEEQLKKERQVANEKLHDAKRALHKRSETSSSRNGSIDARNGGSSKANQALSRLNKELQRELEERDRVLQREAERLHQLDLIYNRALQEKGALEDLLARRNSIITHLMEKLENTQERKAVMENVLLRQATEEIDGGYHRRSDSAMSSR